MSSMGILLLLLSMCAVAVMASSESTNNVIEPGGGGASNEDVLDLLMEMHVAQQSSMGQLQSAMSQLQSASAQLQQDVRDLTAAVMQQNGGCPAGFTYIASVGSCYKVLTSKLDWTAAGRQCRSAHSDAHLLVINDAQEQSAVAALLGSLDQTTERACESAGELRFWTAGQRRTPRSRTFVWRTDEDQAMTYTNWGGREPSSRSEGCVEVRRAHSYQWNDRQCSDRDCPICEVEATVGM